MEAVAVKTGLSLLVMLFGFFQDGLKKLDSKDYPGAIAAFTKVIDHKQADADLRGQALLWRAMAYGKSGKLTEAKADLGAMLAGTGNEALRAKAFATFAELGGDPKQLLPKETPKEAFEKTQKLGLDKNLPWFRRRLGGDLAAMLGMMELVVTTEGHGDPAREISSLCRDIAYSTSKVGTGKELGLAQGTGVVDRGKLQLSVQLVACGDEWHFTSLLDAKPAAGPMQAAPARDVAVHRVVAMEQVAVEANAATEKEAADKAAAAKAEAKKAAAVKAQVAAEAVKAAAEKAVAVKAVAAEAVVKAEAGVTTKLTGASAPVKDHDKLEARLKRVAKALALSASKNGGSYPKTLDEVKPLLDDEGALLVYTDPDTKERRPLLYHRVTGVSNPNAASQTYLLALPVAIDGKRLVAFPDGHVASVAEPEFLAKAKEQGWKETSAKPLISEEELKAKVAALVKQLGDAKPTVRKTAYRELRKLRKEAESILETYRDHPDPEIRFSVRELLKKKPQPVVNRNGMMGMGGGMFQE